MCKVFHCVCKGRGILLRHIAKRIFCDLLSSPRFRDNARRVYDMRDADAKIPEMVDATLNDFLAVTGEGGQEAESIAIGAIEHYLKI